MSPYLGPPYFKFVQFGTNCLFYYLIAIALDRAHAEDAILPIPKIFGLHGEKERYRSLSVDADDVMVDSIRHGNQAKLLDGKGRFSIQIFMCLVQNL